MRGDVVVQQISHADTIQYSVYREINVIHDERTLDSGVLGLPFFLKSHPKIAPLGRRLRMQL